MAEYNVVLLDKDGCETANDLVEGMASAKKTAVSRFWKVAGGPIRRVGDLCSKTPSIRPPERRCFTEALFANEPLVAGDMTVGLTPPHSEWMLLIGEGDDDAAAVPIGAVSKGKAAFG